MKVDSIVVGAAALNTTPLDWTGNGRLIREAVAEAKREGVQLLCLPELCITGYGCEDMFSATHVHERALRLLFEEVAPLSSGLVMCVGIPINVRGGVYNAAALCVDGSVVGFVGKRYLAGDGIHYEPRWFKPWPKDVRTVLEYKGAAFPVGDIFFDVGGVNIGFEICEDAWVSDRPGAKLAQMGVDIILNPSASHFAFGKQEVRRRFILEGTRAFGVGYIYANLLGNEAGRAIYDGSNFIASCDGMLNESIRFSFKEVVLTIAAIDLEMQRNSRMRSSGYVPDHIESRQEKIVIHYAWHQSDVLRNASRLNESEDGAQGGGDCKEDEFGRAVALGIWDYMRKSKSDGFVISLSGGADSASLCVLIHMMVTWALEELGETTFRDRLRHMKHLPNLGGDVKSWVHALLLTAYQSTANSGQVTRAAAQTMANAVGAEHHVLDVEPVRRHVVQMIEDALGRKLEWSTDDVTLQNVQARIRSPGVWMFANIRNALLLCTSNRSEASVGYATMDGDTSGGLAPLAGIDKAYLREWLQSVERKGLRGYAPLSALQCINAQVPTAELRPAVAGVNTQTDEEDLMPYPVLDFIERLAVRDKRSPEDVAVLLNECWPDVTKDAIHTWVKRYFTLFARNQWKRERYAPSFHLDDESLDPKTWCRFPILSGCFLTELQELD